MKNIAIIGCGQLGCKIAVELAYHGHTVKMFDLSTDMLNKARHLIDKDRQQMVAEKTIDTTFPGWVFFLSSLKDAVHSVFMVIECIPDNTEIKRKCFSDVLSHVDSNTIMVTSSLHISINDIVTDDFEAQERTMGLRFLYPVKYIKDVEISYHRYTSQHTKDQVEKFLTEMDKNAFLRLIPKKPTILTKEDVKKRQADFLKEQSKAAKHSDRSPAASDTDSGYSGATPMLGSCVYCDVTTPNCLLQPCHHLVTCHQCASRLNRTRDACPLCRTKVTGYATINYT